MRFGFALSVACLLVACGTEPDDAKGGGGAAGGTGGATSGGGTSSGGGGTGGAGVGGSGVGGAGTGATGATGGAGGSGGAVGGSGGGTPIVFDYYIGVNGSDSNPGTLESPWALTAVNTKRTTYAGKNVGFLDGTYDVRALVGPPQSTNDFTGSWLRVSAGPDADHRTLFMSVNPRGAILDGDRDSGTPHQSAIIGADGDGNLVIDGFKIIRSNYAAVSSYEASNVTVQNCWIDDANYEHLVGGAGQNSGAIRLLAGSNILIRNNLITHFDATADSHRSAGIMPINGATGISDSVFEYNTIILTEGGANSNGIHIKNAGSNRNTVRYNYIEATNGNPVLWHGNTDDDTGIESFHHNVLVGHGELGSFASEGSENHREIYNNTFVGSPGFETVGVRIFDDSGSVDFFNNIVMRNTTGYRGDVNLASISSADIWDHNFYSDASPAVEIKVGPGPDDNYDSLAAWKTASGKDASSLNAADPGFVGSGQRANKYKLTATSACTNAGTSDGTSAGTACDIGAWGNSAPAVIGCDF